MHYSALTALAKAGVVFVGWHEAGCEYDAALFASDGSGDYRDVLSTPNDSLALVRVKPDGTIAEGDLDGSGNTTRLSRSRERRSESRRTDRDDTAHDRQSRAARNLRGRSAEASGD